MILLFAWDTISNVVGGAFGNAIGNAVAVGILVLFLMVGLVIMLGHSFDAALVIITPVVWAAASPVDQGGAGFIPVWAFYTLLMALAGIMFWAGMRMFNR